MYMCTLYFKIEFLSIHLFSGLCILLSSMFGFGTMFLTKDAHVSNSEITIDVEQSKTEMATLVTDDQEKSQSNTRRHELVKGKYC